MDLFESIVAENGAVLYTPATREKKILAARPKQQFVDELQKHGVTNVGTGEVIVSTWHPHEIEVLEVIRDLGLELHVIFNKGAVMILPSGVNKKSGLQAALDALCISEHNVVGVGDAENDHAFLEYCECSAAVANALSIGQRDSRLHHQRRPRRGRDRTDRSDSQRRARLPPPPHDPDWRRRRPARHHPPPSAAAS